MIVVIIRASSLTASQKADNIGYWQTAYFDILQNREGGGPQYLNVGPQYFPSSYTSLSAPGRPTEQSKIVACLRLLELP